MLYSRNEYIIVKQLYSNKKERQTERKVSMSCGFRQKSPCATQSFLDPDISFVSSCDTVKVKMKCQGRLLKKAVVTEDSSC